jgi:hypothetical protein
MRHCPNRPRLTRPAHQVKSRARTVSTIFCAGGITPTMTRGPPSTTVSPSTPPVDDRFAIDEYLVLTVVSPDRVHLDAEFTTEACRHTDGVDARDSERAIANGYPGHTGLLVVLACDAGKVHCVSLGRESHAGAPRPRSSVDLATVRHQDGRCCLTPCRSAARGVFILAHEVSPTRTNVIE